jgi:hypothetical protein
MGAPLQVQPGAVSPQVRDAHAEFRAGSWKKPALIGSITAALVGGLFFGMPAPEEEKKPAYRTVAEPEAPVAVIGASVSPEVIADPDKPSLTNPNPLKKDLPTEEEPAPSPSADQPERSGGFADSFKSAAR